MGDGMNINVWGDNWLPRKTFFKVLSLIPIGLDRYFKVNNLMMEDGASWNETTLEALFWEDQARLIRNIPLSLLKPPDSILWNAEKNGKFTTKSAYHIAEQMG